MSGFERKIDKLTGKNWQELRFAWLDLIPEVAGPGRKPTELLSRNEMIRQQSAFAGQTGDHRFVPEFNLAGQLFHESVYTLHTATRVSCAATQQALDGLPTWSISTAYQGSLLALRSLLGFCGIAYLEMSNCYYLMDVLPSDRRSRRRRPRRIHRSLSNEVQLIKIQQMHHTHWWLMFRRMLRTSFDLFSQWRYPFDHALAQCNPSIVSKHRNRLHYRGIWFFDDLFDHLELLSFGRFDSEECQEVADKLQEENGSDGTLFLCLVLLGISIEMVRDLGKDNRLAEAEINLIDRTLQVFGNEIVTTWFGNESA